MKLFLTSTYDDTKGKQNMDNKDFEFYYKSYKNGNYVGLRLCDESKEKVIKLVKKLKLESPIEDDDLHVTLMYSPTKGNPSFVPSSVEHTATAGRFALFGDERNCLVIKIESESMHNRHADIKAFGFEHTYEDYSPHLTLSYKFEGDKPSDDILEDLGELRFGDEYIAPLEENEADGK